VDLSDRMKTYEGVFKSHIMPKTPAIIRVDGKAFHTWTRGLATPFDEKFYACMAKTAVALVKGIQGATIAYGQSDEISIFIKDYQTYETDSWFGGSVQKMASVAASIATAEFNRAATQLGIDRNKLALFDARVFSLPTHEVTNYFVWRQKDFYRNSVQAVGQNYLGHAAMHKLSVPNVITALKELPEPIDWHNDFEPVYRRGYTYIKGNEEISLNIPDFNQARDYIEVHV